MGKERYCSHLQLLRAAPAGIALLESFPGWAWSWMLQESFYLSSAQPFPWLLKHTNLSSSSSIHLAIILGPCTRLSDILAGLMSPVSRSCPWRVLLRGLKFRLQPWESTTSSAQKEPLGEQE